MTRYYRMVIENVKTGERRTYVSVHQGATPGYPWRCVGVCGYYDK